MAQFRERWLRAEAEMQNLRHRTQREVADARAFAIQKFAGDVVEAAQKLRRGLDALPAQTESEPALVTKLREGFEGVERSFLGVLERNGISRQDAVGKPFDPDLHQAMSEQPAPDGVAPGTVLQAWTSAWTLNGRLLKPAMVVVAAGGAGLSRERCRITPRAARPEAYLMILGRFRLIFSARVAIGLVPPRPRRIHAGVSAAIRWP